MRICVSLGGSIKDYQSGLVQAVKQKADLAELRLDFLQDTLTPFNFQEFAAKSSLPLMTTIR